MYALARALPLLLAVLVTNQVHAQAPEPSLIPTEVSRLAFLLGDWSGEEEFIMMGQSTKSKGVLQGTKAVGGRYVQLKQSYQMDSDRLEGMNLFTFDPGAKKYRGWWFDQLSGEAVELRGDFEGEKLILTSQPAPLPGSPEKVVLRATYWLQEAKLKFVLEMQLGPNWEKMISATYDKRRS